MRPQVWLLGGADSATRQFEGGRWGDRSARREGVSRLVRANKFGNSGGSSEICGLKTCGHVINEIPYNVTEKWRGTAYLKAQTACQQGESAR